MAARRHFIPNFEARSVVLIASFVLSCSTSVMAQTTAPDAASPNSPASVIAPLPATATTPATPATPAITPSVAPAAIPANKTNARELDISFKEADTNRDGKLSRTEAVRYPAIDRRFESIDANKDSFISREEFDKAAGTS